MKVTRFIGYFSLLLTLFIFSIFFINLFEENEINFPEKNLPSGEIKRHFCESEKNSSNL